MKDALLVLNAGSSSIKFALFPCKAEVQRTPALSGQVDRIGAGLAHLDAHDAQGGALERRDLDRKSVV